MTARQRIPLSPEACAAVIEGVDLLADALKVTLGPVARHVAYDPNVGKRPPEILTDGATIARRLIRVPNRFTNMGMMLARHLAWHVRQTVGDGSATAVVLLQTLLHEAQRTIVAGADPVAVRAGMDQALPVVLDALRAMARPVRHRSQIESLCLSTTSDRALSHVLAEALDMVGPDGSIEIEEHVAPYLEREYIEGARWKGGSFSRLFANDGAGVVGKLDDPFIVVSDVWAERAEDVVPVLQAAMSAGAKSLLIVAGSIKDAALATMLLNAQKGQLPCLGVKAPDIGLQRHQLLEDMAILTGGRMFGKDAEGTWRGIRPEDFGHARTAWADAEQFSITGPGGDPAAIRERVWELRDRSRQRHLKQEERQKLLERLGKMAGGTCILKLGATSDQELQVKKQLALDAIAMSRAAQEEGFVPGGGAAYLHCAAALDGLGVGEERFGALALARALCSPLASIADNSGHSSSTVVAGLRNLSSEWGFDAVTGEMVPVWEVGLLDPLKVARVVLEMAVSAAGSALSTDALVLTRRAEAEPFDDTYSDSIEP
jgi:chaperonin GroEL